MVLKIYSLIFLFGVLLDIKGCKRFSNIIGHVRFLEQVIMDGMGLFIPNVEVRFLQHSKVGNNFYYNPCPCGQAKEGKVCPYGSCDYFKLGFGCSIMHA
jgi:hypothetical protein